MSKHRGDYRMYKVGTSQYEEYLEGDIVSWKNTSYSASTDVSGGKQPHENGSSWNRMSEADVTAIGITASAGLTGTMWTFSGSHLQTITIATGGVTTAHIADNAITSSKIADGAILGVDVATGVTLTNPDVTGDMELFGTMRIEATAAGDTLTVKRAPVFRVGGPERFIAIEASGGICGGITHSSGGKLLAPIFHGTTGEFNQVVAISGITAKGISTDNIHVKVGISAGGLVKGNTGEFTDIISVKGISSQDGLIDGYTGEFNQVVANSGITAKGISTDNIHVKSGISAGGLVKGYTGEFTDIISVNGLSAHGGLVKGKTGEFNEVVAISGISSGGLVKGNTGEFTDIISVNGISSASGLIKGKTGEFNEVVAISGISSGGDIECSGSIILAEDGFIGVASDDERIVFDGTGNDVTLRTENVFIQRKLLHNGDGDTFLEFKPNIVSLEAGGTLGFAYNGITFDYADTEVTRPQFKDYAETVNAGGSKSASFNVDFQDGNVQTFTFADDLTVSFTNPPATGIAGTVTLIITNGGANTTTFHSSVKWPGDNAPALTASGVDIVSFTTIDAGTTIYGFVGGINFS
tara:strand:- start:149 stop:1894 length:1746 start_codon:yes stop_codon:yes gene_type:complete